jgi:hypothetical protein
MGISVQENRKCKSCSSDKFKVLNFVMNKGVVTSTTFICTKCENTIEINKKNKNELLRL